MPNKSSPFHEFTAVITKQTLPSAGLFEKPVPFKKKKQYSVPSGLRAYKIPANFPRTEETSNTQTGKACVLLCSSPSFLPPPKRIRINPVLKYWDSPHLVQVHSAEFYLHVAQMEWVTKVGEGAWSDKLLSLDIMSKARLWGTGFSLTAVAELEHSSQITQDFSLHTPVWTLLVVFTMTG